MIPVSGSERIKIIDIIRGFALMGVLISNIYCFNYPADGYIGHYTVSQEPDSIAYWFVRLFVNGKFYTLFSFLFGLSFALQIERLKKKDLSVKSVYLRRLAGLFLIGIIHSIFIWNGDILKGYAIYGFLLFLFRESRPEKMLKWAVILISVLYIAYTSLFITLSIMNNPKDQQKTEEKVESVNEKNRFEPYVTGDYIKVTQKRIGIMFSVAAGGYLAAGVIIVFPMFLLGAYVGRKGYLHKTEDYIPLFKKLFKWSLVLSIISCGVFLYFGLTTTRGEKNLPRAIMKIAELLTNHTLLVLYISSIVLLYKNKVMRKVLNAFSGIGRTALSNYLLQSVVFTAVFYGYGLGFLGQEGVFYLLWLSIVFYAVQIAVSHYWLCFMNIGPAEWIWRIITYKKLQPVWIRNEENK